MSFTDAIKDSVLEGFMASDLTTTSIMATLGVAAVLGIYIYFIYRTNTKNCFYNKSFNKALALLPLVTSGILLAMQSNLIISLGMVGALEAAGSETSLRACVKKYTSKARIRSHNITQKGTETIFELRIKDGMDLVKEVATLTGVISVNLLSHDGEVRY